MSILKNITLLFLLGAMAPMNAMNNELKNFIANPLEDVILAPKSAYLKMLYHDANFKNLSYVYAGFHNANKDNKLQKLIKESNFSTFLSKEKQEELR